MKKHQGAAARRTTAIPSNSKAKNGVESASADGPEVMISVKYDFNILIVNVHKARRLTVRAGKVLAKSNLTKHSDSGEDSGQIQQKTEEANAVANPSFVNAMMVGLKQVRIESSSFCLRIYYSYLLMTPKAEILLIN